MVDKRKKGEAAAATKEKRGKDIKTAGKLEHQMREQDEKERTGRVTRGTRPKPEVVLGKTAVTKAPLKRENAVADLQADDTPKASKAAGGSKRKRQDSVAAAPKGKSKAAAKSKAPADDSESELTELDATPVPKKKKAKAAKDTKEDSKFALRNAIQASASIEDDAPKGRGVRDRDASDSFGPAGDLSCDLSSASI